MRLRPPLRPTSLPVLLAAALGVGSGAAAGQAPDERTCAGGMVSDIFIDNHSIFDPASLPRAGGLRWAYRMANRIHMRTRADFIERELLFREGGCYDPELLFESARILRQFRFIASADVFSIPQPDGTRHVVVETRDEWTTKLSLGVRFEEGLRFEGASVVEENFLGRGALVGLVYLDRDEQRDMGGVVELPRVGGSDWDVAFATGRTRVGSSVRQEVILPFQGEVGTRAFRQRIATRRDLHRWAVPGDDGTSHLVVPVEAGRADIAGARRFGVPGDLLLVGAGVSHEWIRTGGLDEVEAVPRGRYDERTPAGAEAAGALAGQLGSRETTRLSLLLGLRQVRFQSRSGLDALRGVQDVATGRELLLSVGPYVGGSGERDVFGRVDLFGGFVTDAAVGQLFASVEGRRGGQLPQGTRDVLAELNGFLYRPLPAIGPLEQTLVFRAAGHAGWRLDAPFQLTLGGPDGVRGYGESELPGARRVVLSAEDRIVLPGPARELLDLGLTLFGDLGRMYDGGVPFGTDSGWRGTLGAGVRVGFPAGSATVIRADVAFPVGPAASGGPVFRVHAREWLGILSDFRSQQMERSRRSGIRATFPGVSRESREP